RSGGRWAAETGTRWCPKTSSSRSARGIPKRPARRNRPDVGNPEFGLQSRRPACFPSLVARDRSERRSFASSATSNPGERLTMTRLHFLPLTTAMILSLGSLEPAKADNPNYTCVIENPAGEVYYASQLTISGYI